MHAIESCTLVTRVIDQDAFHVLGVFHPYFAALIQQAPVAEVRNRHDHCVDDDFVKATTANHRCIAGFLDVGLHPNTFLAEAHLPACQARRNNV